MDRYVHYYSDTAKLLRFYWMTVLWLHPLTASFLQSPTATAIGFFGAMAITSQNKDLKHPPGGKLLWRQTLPMELGI
jgi:hypothetical protein